MILLILSCVTSILCKSSQSLFFFFKAMIRTCGAALASFTATSAFLISSQSRNPSQTEYKKHICSSERRFVPNCGDLKIFSGSAHPDLAKNIAENLGTNLLPANVARFNDGEIAIKVSNYFLSKSMILILFRLKRLFVELMCLLFNLLALRLVII